MRVEANRQVRTYSVSFEAEDLVTKGLTIGEQDPVGTGLVLAKGWAITALRVETLVDMNGTGTRVIDVGVVGSLEAIAANVDADGTGIETVTLVQYRAPESQEVMVTLTTGTSNPTAGRLVLTLQYACVLREN